MWMLFATMQSSLFRSLVAPYLAMLLSVTITQQTRLSRPFNRPHPSLQWPLWAQARPAATAGSNGAVATGDARSGKRSAEIAASKTES